MDILNTLPFVQDANSDIVTLQGTDTSPDGGASAETSEEQVSDMATKAASSNLKQR